MSRRHLTINAETRAPEVEQKPAAGSNGEAIKPVGNIIRISRGDLMKIRGIAAGLFIIGISFLSIHG
jgi:hypothetical protein